ncbi:MAG TPA: hypothetical protein VMT85_23490 [Thermoanaerobaculia bacterium]|nr:hypothetical protein [Thermoanaerobaculia bacterium]
MMRRWQHSFNRRIDRRIATTRIAAASRGLRLNETLGVVGSVLILLVLLILRSTGAP